MIFRKSTKSEIRHGITAEKIASVEAIPSVISDGKVIYYIKSYKENLDRIVISAPIKIGNTPYYMGVMLQRDNNTQRLYLHNVAIEKGTAPQTLLAVVTENNSATVPTKIVPHSNSNSNPSQHNNSDSGNTNELTGPKSKDDTIYDRLTDEFGAGEDGVDLVRIVREHPYAAVEMIYRNTAEIMRNGMINKYIAGLEAQDYKEIAETALKNLGVEIRKNPKTVTALWESFAASAGALLFIRVCKPRNKGIY